MTSPSRPDRSRTDGPAPTPAGERAELLVASARAARARSQELVTEILLRRGAAETLSPEAMERIERTVMRLEMLASRREMRLADLETARAERHEEREAAELDAWVRERVAPTLRDGWTREELASIGIEAKYLEPPPRSLDAQRRHGAETPAA